MKRLQDITYSAIIGAKNNKKQLALQLLLVLLFLASCQQPEQKQTPPTTDFLLSYTDTSTGTYSYKDAKGTVVIPPGKYLMNFTDTFRTYAIVLDTTAGFLGIDRKGNVLYKVFPYDNGPDAPSEGLFRIVKDGKLGYADYKTGEVVIPIQYPCAWPFKDGKAKVALDCKEEPGLEHLSWESEHWFYIDKTGKKLN
jgi:hypothetical protein